MAYADQMKALREWDFRVSKDSVAMTIAHFYGMNYREQGSVPEELQARRSWQ